MLREIRSTCIQDCVRLLRTTVSISAAGPRQLIYCGGYSSKQGISVSSHDHSARAFPNIRPCGRIVSSEVTVPAGTTANPTDALPRGKGLPQVLQKWVVKRSASGSLKLPRSSLLPVHRISEVMGTIRFVAWPVPVVLRQREQWQWRNFAGSPSISQVTAPQTHPPVMVF
jgi:hypothetical protein